MTVVYAIPGWLGLVLVTLLCAGLACGGHVLVHRSFRSVNFLENNEVAGATASTTSTAPLCR
jgi:hypothetical protein